MFEQNSKASYYLFYVFLLIRLQYVGFKHKGKYFKDLERGEKGLRIYHLKKKKRTYCRFISAAELEMCVHHSNLDSNAN